MTTPLPLHDAPSENSPRKIGRRGFIAFCATVAAALALPEIEAKRMADALATAGRLPVIWLGTQGCTADTESFLRSVDPDIAKLLFDTISLDYHETLMVASGAGAHAGLEAALASPKGFALVVEGAIPTADGGVHCMIGGRTALSLVREVAAKATLTLAVGSCAVDGGLPAAAPNPTGATGVAGAVPGITNLVNLPGCPANGINIVATLAYYLANQALPALDASGRPLFAYQQKVHGSGRCERFPHLIKGEMVSAWGDEGHRNGWCLVHMGCRGPSTYANCYQRNWNQTTWPVGAGAVCIGCTTPKFWDVNTPFYVYRDTRPPSSSSTTSSGATSSTTAATSTSGSTSTGGETTSATTGTAPTTTSTQQVTP